MPGPRCVGDRSGGRFGWQDTNPVAESVLLLQRAFWVGTTDDPRRTALEHLPDELLARGLLALALAVVVLGAAQLVFSRLQRSVPDRL